MINFRTPCQKKNTKIAKTKHLQAHYVPNGATVFKLYNIPKYLNKDNHQITLFYRFLGNQTIMNHPKYVTYYKEQA